MNPMQQDEFYSRMYRIRRIEERIAEEYSKNEMKSPIHLVIGQEACCVGACSALALTDQVYGSHRTHGIYLAKGGSLEKMLCELYCRSNGATGSRGGGMHLIDPGCGVRLTSAIVAGSIPIAVGAALSTKMSGEDTVHCVFFGEGACEEGVTWESINFAVLHNLPVIFFCENNGYSVQTGLAARQPVGFPLYKKAESFGVKASHLDGMSVQMVFHEMERAIGWAKLGQPIFLEAKTYRYRAHGGATDDTHTGYRDQSEYDKWQLFDPLRYWPVPSELKVAVEAEIDAAFLFAKNSPFPIREEAFTHVYQ